MFPLEEVEQLLPVIYLWSQVSLQIIGSGELISPFLSPWGPWGISDGHGGGSLSPSTLKDLHPRLHVPDPLHFRVNGQVTISFQSQEVKNVMGGLSIPKEPCWWSPNGLRNARLLMGWRMVLQVRQDRSLPVVL